MLCFYNAVRHQVMRLGPLLAAVCCHHVPAKTFTRHLVMLDPATTPNDVDATAIASKSSLLWPRAKKSCFTAATMRICVCGAGLILMRMADRDGRAQIGGTTWRSGSSGWQHGHSFEFREANSAVAQSSRPPETAIFVRGPRRFYRPDSMTRPLWRQWSIPGRAV